MTDREDDLRRCIEAQAASGGGSVSSLGYFCEPFRPETGPFSDRVIKVYRPRGNTSSLERLAQAHADYVQLLGDCGVRLPATEFFLLPMAGGRVPVIVQEALPPESLMRPLMADASRAEALAMMEAAGEVIATFWANSAQQPERVGFHPSIRNLAIIDGEGVFFDTFPPLIGYSREEMGQFLIDFSASAFMRALGRVLRARATAVQDEWYSPAGTFVGLVGSAIRLRPEDADAFLDWGRAFARRRMPVHAGEILRELDAPPRLPGHWTALRRLLGLEGEPNV